MIDPAAPAPPRAKSPLEAVGRFAWPAAFVAVAAMTFGYLRDRSAPATSEVTIAHEGPTLVRELRALSRLETASLHVEKVIDVKDHQARLHGLVEADDALVFVASGEVVLGVDLAKVGEDDVRFDPVTKTASITLPEPEVLSARFDEAHSYVHARTTDLLARRNESLEGAARRDAIAAFEKAGREPASMDRAREQAAKTVQSLARAWGAREVVVTWKGPAGEVSLDRR